jgi:hypothetical protein
MTSHIVAAPRKLKDIVMEALMAAEKRIAREAKRGKWSEDQTRQAEIECYDAFYGLHLAARDQKRRECRAVHFGTRPVCGSESPRLSARWGEVTCELCLALKPRTEKR